jgi:predicted aspartyl protease
MEHAVYVIKLKIKHLESENWHLFVAGRVDGEKVNLVVDTGASHSCFDIGFVSQLYNNESFTEFTGISTSIGSNSLQAKMTTLKELKIGRFTLKNYAVILLDLSHVNSAYKMKKRITIQGIVGSDLLKKYGAVIDYKNRRMTLEL